MKLKIIIGVLVFLIVVNVATIGSFVYYRFKQERKIEDTRRPGTHRSDRPYSRIHEEHRGKLVQLFREFRSETKDMRNQIHELQNETFSLMQEDPVPTARVDSLLEEISAVHLEISKAATKKMFEARSFLSPEELKAFFNAIQEHGPGARGGMPFRGRGDRGTHGKPHSGSGGGPYGSI